MCLRYSFSKYCMLSSFIPSKSKRGWDIIFKGSFWHFFVLLIFCEKASASEGCITMTRVWRHCVLCSAPTGFQGRHRRWDRVQHLRGPQVGPSQSAGGALELGREEPPEMDKGDRATLGNSGQHFLFRSGDTHLLPCEQTPPLTPLESCLKSPASEDRHPHSFHLRKKASETHNRAERGSSLSEQLPNPHPKSKIQWQS